MSKPNVWAVFQEGVYRHGCFGVFDDLGLACEAADEAARQDHDDYHEYQVVPFRLGARTDFNHYNEPGEEEAVYSVFRSAALAIEKDALSS